MNLTHIFVTTAVIAGLLTAVADGFAASADMNAASTTHTVQMSMDDSHLIVLE